MKLVHHTQRVMVLATMFASLSSALPFAVWDTIHSQDLAGSLSPQEEVRARAAGSQMDLREKRRKYVEVMRLCVERRKTDETISCPTYQEWEGWSSPKHKNAEDDVTTPTTRVSTIEVEKLSQKDRMLLRRFEYAKTCPESLKDYLQGFYDLCMALVKESKRPAPTFGIRSDVNRIQTRRAIQNPTTNMRLEQFENARPDR